MLIFKILLYLFIAVLAAYAIGAVGVAINSLLKGNGFLTSVAVGLIWPFCYFVLNSFKM